MENFTTWRLERIKKRKVSSPGTGLVVDMAKLAQTRSHGERLLATSMRNVAALRGCKDQTESPLQAVEPDEIRNAEDRGQAARPTHAVTTRDPANGTKPYGCELTSSSR